MLVGEAKGQDKAKEVVRAALNHPLLDVDTTGATGCLLHITGGPDMSLHEAEEVASSLTYELDSHANVIWGARVRKDYEGKVRCLAIMTGIKSAQIMGPSDQRVRSTNSSPNSSPKSFPKSSPKRSYPLEQKTRVPVVRGLNGSIIDQIV
jgi:cell division protein FtsZ